MLSPLTERRSCSVCNISEMQRESLPVSSTACSAVPPLTIYSGMSMRNSGDRQKNAR